MVRIANLDVARIWHGRLEHPSLGKMKKILNSILPGEADWHRTRKVGLPCILAKHHKASFPNRSHSRSTSLLQLIHSDICSRAPSLGGRRYFVNFINDYRCFCWAYILKHKSEAFASFLEFNAQVERQSDLKIITCTLTMGVSLNLGSSRVLCK